MEELVECIVLDWNISQLNSILFIKSNRTRRQLISQC